MTSTQSSSTADTADHPASPLPFTVGVEIEHILALPRNTPYLSPLDYLQHQFHLASLPSSVEYCPKGVDHDYSTWLITTDGSIDLDVSAGVLKEKLNHINKKSDVIIGQWECHGVELVSPPILAPDVFSNTPAVQAESLEIIKRYLDVLVGKASPGRLEHTAFATASCGLHVHIGLPDSQAIPLPVLQHLAYLLLKYEDVLSSMHHHYRTPFPGTQASSFTKSNRVSFLEGRHGAGCAKGAGNFDLEDARRKIFSEGMTVERLAWMMGTDEPLDEDGYPVADAGWMADVGWYGETWKAEADWARPDEWLQESEAAQAVVEEHVVEDVDAAAWSGSEWTAEPSQTEWSSWEDTEIAANWWEETETAAEWQIGSEWHIPKEQPSERSPSTSSNRFSDPYLDGWFNPDVQRFPEGNKHKLSRWNLLARHPCQGPRTLEFRQAAGSVDAEEIAETVRFYVALLRCAERAADADSEGPERCVSSRIDDAETTLEGLLDLLKLPQSACEYWTSRVQKLTEERFFALRAPTTLKHWQKCNVCAAAHDRRVQSRLRHGQQMKGWQAFLKGNTKGKALWNKFSKHGVFKKDKWTATPRTGGPFDSNAVAQPVKFSTRKCKGYRHTFTRKEKTTAKTRARVQARKQAEKYGQRAMSATSLIAAVCGYGAGWTSNSEPNLEAGSDQTWDPASAGALSKPAAGW